MFALLSKSRKVRKREEKDSCDRMHEEKVCSGAGVFVSNRVIQKNRKIKEGTRRGNIKFKIRREKGVRAKSAIAFEIKRGRINKIKFRKN